MRRVPSSLGSLLARPAVCVDTERRWRAERVRSHSPRAEATRRVARGGSRHRLRRHSSRRSGPQSGQSRTPRSWRRSGHWHRCRRPRASCRPTIVLTMKVPPTRRPATTIAPIPGLMTGSPTPTAMTRDASIQSRRFPRRRANATASSVEKAAAVPKIGQAHPKTEPPDCRWLARSPARTRPEGNARARESWVVTMRSLKSPRCSARSSALVPVASAEAGSPKCV